MSPEMKKKVLLHIIFFNTFSCSSSPSTSMLRLGYIVWKWLARTRNLRRKDSSEVDSLYTLFKIRTYVFGNAIKTLTFPQTPRSQRPSHTLSVHYVPPWRNMLGRCPFWLSPSCMVEKKKSTDEENRWRNIQALPMRRKKKKNPNFFPACCCLCCSCIPSTAWWKLNTGKWRLSA